MNATRVTLQRQKNIFFFLVSGTLFTISLQWDITPHQGCTEFALHQFREPAVTEITDSPEVMLKSHFK